MSIHLAVQLHKHWITDRHMYGNNYYKGGIDMLPLANHSLQRPPFYSGKLVSPLMQLLREFQLFYIQHIACWQHVFFKTINQRNRKLFVDQLLLSNNNQPGKEVEEIASEISWFDMWFNIVKPKFLFKTVDLWSYIIAYTSNPGFWWKGQIWGSFWYLAKAPRWLLVNFGHFWLNWDGYCVFIITHR